MKFLIGSGPNEFKKIILLVFLLTLLISFQKPGLEYTIKNRVLAAIKVWDSIEIDFDKLSPNLSEADILTKYSDLKLNCGHEPSALGNRSCYANIRSINGVDAWFLVFFFDRDNLNKVKINITPKGHEEILIALHSKYGTPHKPKNSQQEIPPINWTLRQGILTTNEAPYIGRTTQVLWISKKDIMKKWIEYRKQEIESTESDSTDFPNSLEEKVTLEEPLKHYKGSE